VNLAVVGAFVLVIGVLAVGGVLWLAAGGLFSPHYDPYLAVEIESVAGLNVNAPVKFNGVDVGKVRSIRLDPADPERVRLIFGIERGTPITVDTLAVLKTQGLTGIAYVELEGGARGSAPLLPPADGSLPVIRTKPSLSARLENVLTSVLAKLDNTSSNINALLSDANRAAVGATLADLASVAHTLAARRDSIDAGLRSAALTLDGSARLTRELGPVIERVGAGADSVGRMGEAVAAAGASATRVADSVGADVHTVSRDALPGLERLMTELTRLSVSMHVLSEQLARSPSSLLLGPGPERPGPGESPTPPAPRCPNPI
jgi:phospholipid/cholesterol/gamma-HCH transport system substrate-binding protein